MVHHTRKRYLNNQRKEQEAKERAIAAANAVFDTAKLAEARLAQMAENRYGPQAEGNVDLRQSKASVVQVIRRVPAEVLARRQSLFALNEAAGDIQKLEILTGLSADEIGELLDGTDFDQKIAEHIAISLNLPIDWLDTSDFTLPDATKNLIQKSVEELSKMENDDFLVSADGGQPDVVQQSSPAEEAKGEQENFFDVDGNVGAVESMSFPVAASSESLADFLAPEEQQAEIHKEPEQPIQNESQKLGTKKMKKELADDPDFPVFCQLFRTLGKLRWFISELEFLTPPTLIPFIKGQRTRNVSKDTYRKILYFLGMSLNELRADAPNNFVVTAGRLSALTGMDPYTPRNRGRKSGKEPVSYFEQNLDALKARFSSQGELLAEVAQTTDVPEPEVADEAPPVNAKLARKTVIDYSPPPVVTIPPPAPERPASAQPQLQIAGFSAREQPAVSQPAVQAPPPAANPEPLRATPARAQERPSRREPELLDADLRIIGSLDAASPEDLVSIAAVKKVVESFNNGRLNPDVAARIIAILQNDR